MCLCVLASGVAREPRSGSVSDFRVTALRYLVRYTRRTDVRYSRTSRLGTLMTEGDKVRGVCLLTPGHRAGAGPAHRAPETRLVPARGARGVGWGDRAGPVRGRSSFETYRTDAQRNIYSLVATSPLPRIGTAHSTVQSQVPAPPAGPVTTRSVVPSGRRVARREARTASPRTTGALSRRETPLPPRVRTIGTYPRYHSGRSLRSS